MPHATRSLLGSPALPRWLACVFFLILVCPVHAQVMDDDDLGACGSTYLPVDSWQYPELVRLRGLGYLDDAFLGLRPWTRIVAARLVRDAAERSAREEQEWTEITQEEGAEPGGSGGAEARAILAVLTPEFAADLASCNGRASVDSVYSRTLGITDTPLRDSFHLGQTISNDYGRPYEAGINQVVGVSGRASRGRFSLYLRGEYQRAASAAGYSPELFATLSSIDTIPVATNPVQSTIPLGPLAAVNAFRLLEANASYHLLGHEISFGKSDHWMGPAEGASMTWSNNADNIYAFQIDRVDPLRVPLLSRAIGPMRYDFFVGSLQGHSDPRDPWVHVEKISFKPSANLEFGFERTVIWGGKGHVPITVHSFLKSFFSLSNVPASEKFSRSDPGARFGSFDFSYRLPFARDWLTLYTDSEAHDDVSPISAPRRAGIRPGLYLSHFPALPKLDLRVEGASTDPPTSRSNAGAFLMAEIAQPQGLTNKGFLFTDPNGREGKGGNAWLTYHMSPTDNVQLSWRSAKAAKDLIPGGTTQQQFRLAGVKRLGVERDLEASVWVQYEAWKAPIYRPGAQSDISVAGALTWYPQKSLHF